MKIFVTGGTGTIGDLLISRLLETGHEITIITRNINHVTNKWRDEINIVEGDVTQRGDWENELTNQDAVVNLAGENIFSKRWTKSQKEKIYTSRIESTKNLASIINDISSPPKIVISVSGVDYYPSQEDVIYTEEDDSSSDFLGKLCYDWEKPLNNLPVEIRGIIFRMGVVFGYSGKTAEKMFTPHKFFVGGWLGDGSQTYSWIHINDFVGLLIWALSNEKVSGVYNGVAPDTKTMKELAVIGGKVLRKWTWTWVPGFFLKLILGKRAKLLLCGRKVSSKKLIGAGYSFEFPLAEDAIEDIVKNF